jgi:hypothetical protein
MTGFAEAACVADREPSGMLLSLGDGARNTGFFSSPVKTEMRQIIVKRLLKVKIGCKAK